MIYFMNEEKDGWTIKTLDDSLLDKPQNAKLFDKGLPTYAACIQRIKELRKGE